MGCPVARFLRSLSPSISIAWNRNGRQADASNASIPSEAPLNTRGSPLQTTVAAAGHLLNANAERHLKPVTEMQRLFRNSPEAIDRALEIAERCQFTLDSHRNMLGHKT